MRNPLFRTLIRPLIAVVLLTLGWAQAPGSAAESPKERERFFYFLEGDLLGGYSKIQGREGLFAASGRWLASPVVRLWDRFHWINLYTGSYDRSSQVVAQEEGGRQSEETLTHGLNSAFRWEFAEGWAVRPLVFADWVYVKETDDEDLGDGLYDYRDLGGGLELTRTLAKTETSRLEARTGGRIFEREYENYLSLVSLFDPNGSPEVHEKDFTGYKWNIALQSDRKEGWSAGAEYILLYKDFTDKRTINSNGIRSTDETREDFVHYLMLNASHPLPAGFRLRLDVQLSHNDSNLDFYDTRNTAGLGDDTFVPGYFDYLSVTAGPSIGYRRQIGEERFFEASVGYAYTNLSYSDRKAQDAAGVYGTDEEEDEKHVFSARTSVPLTRHLAWISSVSYTIADSNQKFENFYLYNYESWTALSGLSFRY